MTVRVSCPFCNAGVPLSELPQTGRVACPRCGESFTVKPGDLEHAPSNIPAASPNGEYAPPVPQPTGPSPIRAIWPLALMGLAFAAVVVGGGLYAILRTPTKPTEPAPADKKPPATIPPASVPGLAYLPGDTSIAFAVQFGPLLAYAERSNTDPRQPLTDAGVPAQVFVTLDRLGLTLDQIDQLCGGLVVAGDNPIPRVVVALLLTKPVADESAFLKQLKATQFTAPSGATRYKGVDLGVPIPFELAKHDAKTYLFATDGKDLDAAVTAAGRGSGHVPLGVKESMARLSPASVAWAATDSTNWADKPLVKVVADLTKQSTLPLRRASVRSVAVGLSLEPEPQATVAVRTAGDEEAAKLRERLTVGLPATVGRDGLWVTVAGPLGKGQAGWLRDLLPKPPGN